MQAPSVNSPPYTKEGDRADRHSESKADDDSLEKRAEFHDNNPPVYVYRSGTAGWLLWLAVRNSLKEGGPGIRMTRHKSFNLCNSRLLYNYRLPWG